MYMEQVQLKKMLQVEMVDNWHSRWREVVDAIAQLGQRSSLCIDEDGWLSARHNLLVAFIDDAVAGHLSFRVQPIEGSEGQSLLENERPIVEAQLESIGVQSGFDRMEVESLLRASAVRRARALHCRRLVGLNG